MFNLLLAQINTMLVPTILARRSFSNKSGVRKSSLILTSIGDKGGDPMGIVFTNSKLLKHFEEYCVKCFCVEK